MTKVQNDNLRKILDWLETCPIQYSITSMSGDCVFIKCIDTSKNIIVSKFFKFSILMVSIIKFILQDLILI